MESLFDCIQNGEFTSSRKERAGGNWQKRDLPVIQWRHIGGVVVPIGPDVLLSVHRIAHLVLSAPLCAMDLKRTHGFPYDLPVRLFGLKSLFTPEELDRARFISRRGLPKRYEQGRKRDNNNLDITCVRVVYNIYHRLVSLSSSTCYRGSGPLINEKIQKFGGFKSLLTAEEICDTLGQRTCIQLVLKSPYLFISCYRFPLPFLDAFMAIRISKNNYSESDNLHDRIYKILRERICLGQISPGEVLSENALAQEFGVSRTPIRRVLQRLENDNLVSAKHGIGTIVTPIDMIEIKELYELRMKLAELFGVLSPVARVSEEDILTFEDFLRRCKELYDLRDPAVLASLNIEMHEMQLRHIGNRALRDVFDQLYYRSIRLWMQLLSEMNWEEEVRALQGEIEQTLEAMRNNDIYTIGLIRRNGMSLCLGRIKKYIGGST